MLKQLFKMLVSFFFNYGVGDDHGKDICGITVKNSAGLGRYGMFSSFFARYGLETLTGELDPYCDEAVSFGSGCRDIRADLPWEGRGVSENIRFGETCILIFLLYYKKL